MTFKRVRIALLLVVLIGVALQAWSDRRQLLRWTDPLIVGIYPIAGEPSAETREYIESLNDASFDDIAPFFLREGERYDVPAYPVVVVRAGPEVKELPPAPPDDRGLFSVVFWSLSLRWWTWRAVDKYELGDADVRMFVIYHAPIRGRALEHSLGLEGLRVGVAHLFSGADEESANDVVIAHELFHVAGATDKYDENGRPIAPIGYADPAAGLPQERAEIMAGRIAISETESKNAESLELCVVGERTAQEIGWYVVD